MSRWSAILVMCLAALVGACGDNDGPTAPSINVPFSSTDLVVGTGAEATTGKILSVHYTGWLYSTSAADNKGTQFDSSVGKSPLVFVLGTGQVIRGWDQGLVGMKVGGTRRLVIPPNLGYGSSPIGSIPGNSTLVFDVQLLSVQ